MVFIRRAISRSHLVALYATADVAWVTPLRDGMNLVAKEYVACHRDGGGALVLSEFAGAAAEMGEAFIVNPYDTQHTVLTLERVLKLTPDEQRERMTALYTRVQRNDAVAWSRHCLDSFTSQTDDSALELPRQLDADDLVAAVHRREAATVPPQLRRCSRSVRSRATGFGPIGPAARVAHQPGGPARQLCRRGLRASSIGPGALVRRHPRRVAVGGERRAHEIPGDRHLGSAGPEPCDQGGRNMSGRSSSTSSIAPQGPSSRPRSTRSSGTTASPIPSSASG